LNQVLVTARPIYGGVCVEPIALAGDNQINRGVNALAVLGPASMQDHFTAGLMQIRNRDNEGAKRLAADLTSRLGGGGEDLDSVSSRLGQPNMFTQDLAARVTSALTPVGKARYNTSIAFHRGLELRGLSGSEMPHLSILGPEKDFELARGTPLHQASFRVQQMVDGSQLLHAPSRYPVLHGYGRREELLAAHLGVEMGVSGARFMVTVPTDEGLLLSINIKALLGAIKLAVRNSGFLKKFTFNRDEECTAKLAEARYEGSSGFFIFNRDGSLVLDLNLSYYQPEETDPSCVSESQFCIQGGEIEIFKPAGDRLYFSFSLRNTISTMSYIGEEARMMEDVINKIREAVDAHVRII